MAIVTALTSLFVSIGFSAVVAGVISSTLVNIGLSLAFGALNKPEEPGKRTAITGDAEIGADTPRSAVVGKFKLEGQVVHYNHFGKGNRFNQWVHILSDGWCDGLEPYVFIKGEKKALVSETPTGSEIARYSIEDYGNSFDIRFFDGRPGQAACDDLVDNANPSENWESTAKLTNVCYVNVRMRFGKKNFSGGIPKIEFVLRGLRLYDWRKDSTMAGGSGSHRINDPATWEWTENPAVIRYNYKRGLVFGARNGTVILGEGLPQASLDHSSYTFSANACDATNPVTGTGKTYKVGTRAICGRPHSEFLDIMDSAMAGYRVDRSGLDGVIAGAAQVPAFSITSRDLRTDEDISRPSRRGRSELVNIMTGTFTNPDSDFEPDSLGTIRDTAAIDEDKIELPRDIDLKQINDGTCAQYVLTVRYRQNRYMASRPRLPVSAYLSMAAEVGDWCTFEGKTWLVTRTETTSDLRGYLDLSETHADAYSGTLPTAFPDIPAPGGQDDGQLDQTVSGLTISSVLVEAADHASTGRQWPALAFGYTEPDDPTVTGILFQWRAVGGSEVFSDIARRNPVTEVFDGSFTVTDGVAGGQLYEVRATLETEPARTTTWTDWVAETEATGAEVINLDSFAPDIRESISRARTDIDAIMGRYILPGFQDVTLALSDGWRRTETVAAVAENARAAVVTEAEARASGDAALASLVAAVQAEIDNFSGGGLFKVEAIASPSGVDVRLALFARASDDGGETWKESGLYIDVNLTANGGESQIALAADSVIFTDGSATSAPFAFIGSELVFNGVIRSADGKFRIDGASGTITISD